MTEVAVLGAGVVGLSTAVLALEAGHSVTIYTALEPMQTTSAKAAASVIPHTVELANAPADLLARSLARFAVIERSDPAAGVRWHLHWEASSSPLSSPEYLSQMRGVVEATGPDVPGGYSFGRSYEAFMAETPRYLPWLATRVAEMGGRICVVPPFRDLSDVQSLAERAVINCTGLGARELCADRAMRPVRGQIAIVGPHPELGYSISHGAGFYVYPRATETVIGGTNEFDADSGEVQPAVVRTLLSEARRILPELGAQHVLRTYAGLRPYREGSLRLEAETLGRSRIVHNYGHGGAGVTLAWGSAEHALNLL